MDWPGRGLPNPFRDARRECEEELDYAPDLGKLRLIGMGLDTKEMYVQFSFAERTDRTPADIILKAERAQDATEIDDLFAVEFTPAAVADILTWGEWEPAAGAAVLTLAAEEFKNSSAVEVELARLGRPSHLRRRGSR